MAVRFPKYEVVRGVPDNLKKHPAMKNVLLSANLMEPYGFRWYVAAHAMLTLLQPGDYWPASTGQTVPVELSHVHVSAKFRRQGHGEALVRQCLGYASRRRWPVVLRVTPYGRGNSTMSVDQLTHWYAKLGFRLLEKAEGLTYMALDYRR